MKKMFLFSILAAMGFYTSGQNISITGNKQLGTVGGGINDPRMGTCIISHAFGADAKLLTKPNSTILPQGTLTNRGKGTAKVYVWLVADDGKKPTSTPTWVSKGTANPSNPILLGEADVKASGSINIGKIAIKARQGLPAGNSHARIVITVVSSDPISLNGTLRPPASAKNFPGDILFPGDTFFPGEFFIQKI
jgi:hypothetical protein